MKAEPSKLLYAKGAVPKVSDFRMEPACLQQLMRVHGHTIRSLAKKHGLTMKRVREVRTHGVAGFLAEDWHQLITGKWPDEVQA